MHLLLAEPLFSTCDIKHCHHHQYLQIHAQRFRSFQLESYTIRCVPTAKCSRMAAMQQFKMCGENGANVREYGISAASEHPAKSGESTLLNLNIVDARCACAMCSVHERTTCIYANKYDASTYLRYSHNLNIVFCHLSGNSFFECTSLLHLFRLYICLLLLYVSYKMSFKLLHTFPTSQHHTLCQIIL